MNAYPLLSDIDILVKNTLREFVDREIMPIRQKIDADSEHFLLNRIFSKLENLGLSGGISLVESFNDSTDIKISFVTSAVMIEELSRGDVGIGIVSAITGWALMPALLGKNREIIELFKRSMIGKSPIFACFAMTEPNSGCDIENLDELRGTTIKTTARFEDDCWIINGTKRFASNAAISLLYCIVCRIQASDEEDGIALIYVPAGTEGMHFGKFEEKAGLYADKNADIYLDNVRVPYSYRASSSGMDSKLLVSNLSIGRVASAAAAVGAAQGVFEEVLKYTESRKVGGKPIRDHSIGAGIIAEMATGIETARAYYINVAYMLSNPEKYGLQYSSTILSYASICKNYATNVAILVTNKAMELMGSYGYMKEYLVEKYWRDVKEIQLWLGGPQLGQFDIVRGFYPFRVKN